jgi:hypothetical protein
LLSKSIKEEFDGDEEFPSIVWSITTSAERLGEIFDKWVAAFADNPDDPLVFFVDDFNFYDCSQSEASSLFENSVLRAVGCPDKVIDGHIDGSVPRGSFQRYDITFKAGHAQRTTGDNITSVGNTMDNIASHVGVLGEPGPRSWVAMFQGDDVLGVSRRSFFKDLPVVERFAELGLSVDHRVTDDITDIDFCQNLPYPSSTGTVFAPKIGRLLFRLGWCTTDNPADVFGIAMGLRKTVAHVPFLREFVEAHLSFSPSTTQSKMWCLVADSAHETCPETWDFIYQRYGLTQQDFAQFRHILAATSKRQLPVGVPWPRIVDLVERDE